MRSFFHVALKLTSRQQRRRFDDNCVKPLFSPDNHPDSTVAVHMQGLPRWFPVSAHFLPTYAYTVRFEDRNCLVNIY